MLTTDSYPLATWRLLHTPPADGATNMAVDEAILRAVAAGKSPPTLRLYAWSPPCLSLGWSQPVADADREALRAAGFDLVRRPTGGRAILHADELTYSVIVPQDDPRVQGGVVTSYRRLSAALVRGLELLGVADIVADRRASETGVGSVCFEVPSDYEITVGGRKLVGSAQMRAQAVVLQHGAIPLGGDIARIGRVLSKRPDPERVRRRATTLSEALGRPVAWEEAAAALAAGFAAALNLRWEEAPLTPEEVAAADALRERKYAAVEWTDKV